MSGWAGICAGLDSGGQRWRHPVDRQGAAISLMASFGLASALLGYYDELSPLSHARMLRLTTNVALNASRIMA